MYDVRELSQVMYNKTPKSVVIGGYVETFAAGSTKPQAVLATDARTGTIHTNIPVNGTGRVSLAKAVGMSSWFPGFFFSTWFPFIESFFGFKWPYWAPSSRVTPPPRSPVTHTSYINDRGGTNNGEHNSSYGDVDRARGSSRTDQKEHAEDVTVTEMLVGDGGTVDNFHLFGALRRKCAHIVMFVNTVVPLKSKRLWDPEQIDPTSADIDNDVSSYFGYNLAAIGQWEIYNQVFKKSSFVSVVKTLQASALEGHGAIGTFELPIVDNAYWGIKGGDIANITIVYNSRVLEWERLLPNDLQHLIVPSSHADDPSVTKSSGALASFPHLSTRKLGLSNLQTNTLADVASYVVLRHADLFTRALLLD